MSSPVQQLPARVRATPVRMVLRPGQRGTRELCRQHGAALLAVRYRYDVERALRHRTVELVVDERPWQRRVGTGAAAARVHVLLIDRESRRAGLAAGASFDPGLGLWSMPRREVARLQLQHRIVDAEHEHLSSAELRRAAAHLGVREPAPRRAVRDARTGKTMLPGARGTRKLLKRHGQDLILVRYRYSERCARRYTTVELLVDTQPFVRRPTRLDDGAIVPIYLKDSDDDLRRILPYRGASWNPELGAWMAPYELARTMGIQRQVGYYIKTQFLPEPPQTPNSSNLRSS